MSWSKSRASGCGASAMTMSRSSKATAPGAGGMTPPYDAILAAASGSHVPEALIAQLAPGGRLVMPIGDPGGFRNWSR